LLLDRDIFWDHHDVFETYEGSPLGYSREFGSAAFAHVSSSVPVCGVTVPHCVLQLES
jgi:hypothetical protein